MTFDELLNQHEDTLLNLKKDLIFLLAFEELLIEKTKGKPFVIKNDIVFRMVLQQVDMLVINLASLAKGMLGRKGFFNHLAANLHELKPITRKAIQPSNSRVLSIYSQLTQEEEQRIQQEIRDTQKKQIFAAHREALFNLFPKTKGREPLKITKDDIKDLKDTFAKIVSDIQDDRDNNRAHRYEKVERNPNVLHLTIKKIEERFLNIEKLMNSL